MVKITNLSFKYNKNSDYILKDVNLIIKPNKVSIILGNNGIGKTTLFRCISGINKNFDGRILVDGLDVKTNKNITIAKKVSYVFQNFESSNLSVYETILLGRTPYINIYPKNEDYEIVNSLIKRFKLETFANYPFSLLSGGYKQIVMIARALATKSDILLFDEITANLDISNKIMVFNIIKDLVKEGKTIISSMHDINDALKIGDYFYFLADKKIVLSGDKKIINSINIKKIYNTEVVIKNIEGEKYVIYKK